MLRLHDVRSIRVAWVLTGIAALALTCSCGGGSSPSGPPTVAPTPTPVPTATPTPPESVCNPTPPPLYGIRVKVHQDSGFRKILDSRPLVVNMNGYCESAVGLSGAFCVTRREGDDQAWACDYLAMGQALDTGRWGPTWYWNGLPCTSEGDTTPGCRNDPNNQFLLIAKGPGTYAACASPTVAVGGDRCGELVID
ncbi:MAG TPA: hypothetical protein VMT70_15125 [Vicinamibacteria bacterium]|nr:hypothetical protein [Vicinamibacteria bacterium]